MPRPPGIRFLTPALLRVVAIGAAGAGSGLLFGEAVGLIVVVAGFGMLLAVHLYFLARLGAWLDAPSAESVPEGVGAWQEVFARLYRMRRASEQNERRLTDNEERFRRTITALPEGIVLVDAALQIEWCNPVAERHLGIRLRADQGLRLINLVRDPAFVAYLTAPSADAPLVFRPHGNPALALRVAVVEFEPSRSIVITRDVTQSERVDAVRRDFVANVSHELRTPLTVINGFLETLIDSGAVAVGVHRQHLDLMHDQAQRMSRLIEDLLTLSRLESRDSQPAEERIEVDRLLAELAEEARALSDGRHTLVVEGGGAWLRGGRDELRSAFSNLVTNAVRYTPTGGRITLRWCDLGADGGAFEVEDTGIGIAPEHVPRLTERFYRVDKSRSRETGGTGLGLAIAKHVLLRHQGRLDVRSQLGAGSVFSAILPAARIDVGVGRPERQAA